MLEERRDLLAQLMLSQLNQAVQLNEKRDRLFDRVRSLVRHAAMRHGLPGLQRLSASDVDVSDPQWRIENRLGIPWLTSVPGVAAPAGPAPSNKRNASLEVATAVSALHQLLENLLQVAEVENNLTRLTQTFRRTQRRVNALDHIILPELNTDVRAMEGTMDEMERDDLVRALLIKRAQTDR